MVKAVVNSSSSIVTVNFILKENTQCGSSGVTRRSLIDVSERVTQHRSIAVILNLGSRDPVGVPNANLGSPKRKSGISTNFPQYFCLALVTSSFCVYTTHLILFSQPFQFRLLVLLFLSSLSLRAGSN